VAGAVPAGVPHEAADAVRDTLGGGLPGEIGGAVVHAAREAFTQGLQVTAAVCVAVVGVAAVLAVRLLRRESTGAETSAEGSLLLAPRAA
jgi:DHA2 family multidrug resistance protein-like MFS transporter